MEGGWRGLIKSNPNSRDLAGFDCAWPIREHFLFFPKLELYKAVLRVLGSQKSLKIKSKKSDLLA